MENLFLELGIVIIFAGVISVLGHLLKQPLILGYVLAGVIIGPYGLGLIHDVEFIHIVATIGIMLMLFLVGLEMDYEKLKDIGIKVVLIGAGQVLITGTAGFLVLHQLFHFSTVQSAYMALGMTFASSIIAVTLLTKKKAVNAFYGQMTIGVLMVQDILAIIALMLLAGFEHNSLHYDLQRLIAILLRGLGLIGGTFLVSKYVLPKLFSKVANSTELLIIVSLSWAFIISALALKIGFSIEVGAFIAGMALANLPYSLEITSKSRVLSGFFIVLFFVALGAGLVFSSVAHYLPAFLFISAFVLVINPFIVFSLMGLLGYDKRNAFFTALAITNISEFSLFVMAFGAEIGHINHEIVSLITIIAISTMVLSSYLMTYNKGIYRKIKHYLPFYRRKGLNMNEEEHRVLRNHIIILGCGNMGSQILEQVLAFKDDYVVVDHNNEVIEQLREKGIHCVFGDTDDEELYHELNFEEAEIIISTLPNPEDNHFLLRHLKTLKPGKRPIVLAVATSGREGFDLFLNNVDYVIVKPYLGAHHVHSINKELYELEEELEDVKIIPRNEFAGQQDRIMTDQDYANLLNGLNKLRFKEIKEKLKQEKLKKKTPKK